MSFHLTVAGSLEPLADALAELLARPHPGADPFRPELLIVPSAGVRSWLGGRLAERLGATERGRDGIATNLTYAFPNRILAETFGDPATTTGDHPGAWHTGPLTWTVFDELVANGPTYKQPADAVRARAIADLFDRYTLHRQTMVMGWDRGSDSLGGDREAAPHEVWQPELWRAVRARTGGRSDAERTRELLRSVRANGVDDDVPPRVIVFGLASLPPPHLEVLGALSASRDVHVFAPTPSGARWQRLVELLPAEMELPIPRDDPRFPELAGHPLVTDWGRTSAEAQALLHLTAVGAGAQIDARFAEPPRTTSLLQRVQHDIITDTPPVGAPRDGAADERLALDADDDSIRWHKCYGASRQVEVLRDAILHVLAEKDASGAPRYAPRDIAILTPDIGRFAPLVDAAFAGDAPHGVPAIPLEVADRTLRQDNRLVDGLLQLLDLTEGRFRATDLLRFLSSPVVRRRFGLDAAAIERIGTWVHDANVRWGIDGTDLERFGIPASLDAFTWRSAIDRLLLGATLPDGPARLGLGGVPPTPGVEGDDVLIAGRLSEAVRAVSAAVERLTQRTSVHDWCEAVAASMASLFRLSDDDAWASRPVDRALADLEADASVDGAPDDRDVDPSELAALLRVRLETGSSRPRFGTGSVTLSSLTAQRGVPYRVVFVLGLDSEVSAVASADDLIAARPCIGDRDARGEQRAQLLDAVLAAGERFVVLSNGRDIRSNTPLPPVAMFAELLEVIDDTAVGADGRAARDVISFEHPRQAWSERSFLPGHLGVHGAWSFDTGARDAAIAREHQHDDEPFLPAPIPSLPHAGDEERVSIDDLALACTEPVRAFLSRRLGIFVPGEAEETDDAIPFLVSPLEQSALDRALLAERLQRRADWSPADTEEWREVMRRRGEVPPDVLGDAALDEAVLRTDGVMAVVRGRFGDDWSTESLPVRVDVPGLDGDVLVEGTIDGLSGDTVVEIRLARPKIAHVIDAWIRVALLTMIDPTRDWCAVLISRAEVGDGFAIRTVKLTDPGDARIALEFAVEMWQRSQTDVLPVFPETSRAIVVEPKKAPGRWNGGFNSSGERSNAWNALAFDMDFDELDSLPRRDHETVDPVDVDVDSRLQWWAHRLWDCIHATTVAGTMDEFDDAGAPA